MMTGVMARARSNQTVSFAILGALIGPLLGDQRPENEPPEILVDDGGEGTVVDVVSRRKIISTFLTTEKVW